MYFFAIAIEVDADMILVVVYLTAVVNEVVYSLLPGGDHLHLPLLGLQRLLNPLQLLLLESDVAGERSASR